MRRTFNILLSFSILVIAASSCDMMRWIAGRPNAEEVVKMGQAIEKLKLDKTDTTVNVVVEPETDMAETSKPTAAKPEAVKPTVTKSETVKPAVTAKTTPAARSNNASELSSYGFPIVRYSKEKHKLLEPPAKSYYFIIGLFGVKSNAERLASKASAAGFSPELLPAGEHSFMVSLGSADSASEMARILEKSKGCPFVPKAAWILAN